MKESHDDILYKMALVGYFTTFKKNGKQESPKLKVFVCGNEDFAIPHMHIWDDETDGKKIHACIRLDKMPYRKRRYFDTKAEKVSSCFLERGE